MIAKCTIFTLLVASVAYICAGEDYTYLTCEGKNVHEPYAIANNPNIYYVCKDKNTPYLVPCGEGYGFVRNSTIVGCVAWSKWGCTNLLAPPKCTAATVGQRFASDDPNNYWECDANKKAQIKTCPTNMAYVECVQNCVFFESWQCNH